MWRRDEESGSAGDDVIVPATVADLLCALTSDDAGSPAVYQDSAAAAAYRRRYRRGLSARPARMRIAAKAAAIIAASTIGVGSVTAAAYAGVLPGPAQRVAHRLIHAPSPKADRARHPDHPRHRGLHGPSHLGNV